jgi:hypothetical protein
MFPGTCMNCKIAGFKCSFPALPPSWLQEAIANLPYPGSPSPSLGVSNNTSAKKRKAIVRHSVQALAGYRGIIVGFLINYFLGTFRRCPCFQGR